MRTPSVFGGVADRDRRLQHIGPGRTARLAVGAITAMLFVWVAARRAGFAGRRTRRAG
ncbi:hypothetical protein [Actinoplanes sp. CA-252034]|uniref:hypothetical protein n=1 Tax=Actinoplanes sp. CA-252034 TaxID=3239906 RepID=UPI003D97B400